MKRPTALLIPSPWSGDDYARIPRTYPLWFWLYKTTRSLRHKLGLHDWDGILLTRCTWCGQTRTAPNPPEVHDA